MAEDVVIHAEGLGKKYIIGHQAERERYTALRDVAMRNFRGLWRKTADMARGRAIVGGDTTEEFWALKDINFEVKRGEVLGVIGRNGAGKSTLLKILSRITEPSEGRVTLKGRVASLLEVGTGFHPELTGRENIFLNGGILGMSRAEIRGKFDEIVGFAEVERFLDTPVKRYSSGMYVRLAFAVAAHLEPEILLVDEVLAVGDAEFQRRCIGKMKEVAVGGRTVIFVTHNMGIVRKLCNLGLLISDGRIETYGRIDECVSQYARDRGKKASGIDLRHRERRGTQAVRIAAIQLPTLRDKASLEIFETVHIRFELEAESEAAMAASSVWFHFISSLGDELCMMMQKDSSERLPHARQALVEAKFELGLPPGQYRMACGILRQKEVVDWIDEALVFNVDQSFSHGEPFDGRVGLTTNKAAWSTSASAIER